MRILILLALALTPLDDYSQDYSGFWSGYIGDGENKVIYELVILPGNEKITGYGMTRMIIDGVINTGIKEVAIRIRKNKVELEDADLIFSDFSKPGKKMILSALLEPYMNAGSEKLEGKFRTRSVDFRDKSYYAGEMYLVRQVKPEASTLLAKLDEMKLYPPSSEKDIAISASFQKVTPAEKNSAVPDTRLKAEVNTKENGRNKAISPAEGLNNSPVPDASAKNRIVNQTNAELTPAALFHERKKYLINTFYFTGDSITVNIYDNGEVDGDTVSVLLDEKLILAKKRLDTKPISFTLQTPPGTDSMELTMYAENLGAYPPNTGLLVIYDGINRHEIRFSGDLTKSSSIRLRRK